MKTLFKFSAFLLFLSIVSSCSNDDDNTTEKGKEAIIKVEVSNNQTSNFEEVLNIQIVADNVSQTEVTGTTWDEKQNPSENAKWFLKQGDVKPSIVYQTTNKVSSLTYSVVITSKLATNEPLITVLKFYVDDKLVKTETISTLDQASNVTVPIVVN